MWADSWNRMTQISLAPRCTEAQGLRASRRHRNTRWVFARVKHIFIPNPTCVSRVRAELAGRVGSESSNHTSRVGRRM